MATEKNLGVIEVEAAESPREPSVTLDMPARVRWSPLDSSLRYIRQEFFTSLPLCLADFTALALSIAAAASLLAALSFGLPPSFWRVAPALAIALGLTQFVVGLYPGLGLAGCAELRLLVLSSTLATGVFLAALFVRGGESWYAELLLLGTYPFQVVLIPVFRSLTRTLCARQSWWGVPAVILGGGAEGIAAYKALDQHRLQGLRPIGILDDFYRQFTDDSATSAELYLGPLSETNEIAAQRGAFWGVVAMSRRPAAETAAVIDEFAATIPHLLVLPDLSAAGRSWDGAHSCGGARFVRIDERLLIPSVQMLKRMLDILLTLAAAPLIVPFAALLALAVKCTSPGPVFYSHWRVGRGGRLFRMWKFRSMVVNADAALREHLERHPELKAEYQRFCKLKRDPRITWLGRILRKTSLDELPQLWNVLIGDMSLVGPRPLLVDAVQQYGVSYQLYVRTRPGITGPWQINGRNLKTFEERIYDDIEYLRNWSVWLDVLILFRTIKVVLRCEGAY